MFKKGDLVEDGLGIYLVLASEENLDSRVYTLKFLAFLSDQNIPGNILEVCEQTTRKKEKELGLFEGKAPKFACGDYVRYDGTWGSLSRIFFAVYKSHQYVYFVQREANRDLYEGIKEWVEEKHLSI